VVVGYLQPGDIIGEMAFLKETSDSVASATVLTNNEG
jgi:CRP-like cAMP-binding protein